MHPPKRFAAWDTLLAGANAPQLQGAPLAGWETSPSCPNPIVEPRMHYAPGMPSAAESKIILVAAPGAVGKSALARHLAAQYNHVLVDLAETGPVGEHFVAGGLFRAYGARAVEDLEAGKAGLIFDALDEARLRVTTEAFEAFLRDLADLGRMPNTRPILIFGRTATVEAAWLAFTEAATRATISEINFFNASEAKRFIDGYVATLDKEGAIARHRPAYEKRRDELLDKLSRDTTHATGSVKFDGYAPAFAGRVKGFIGSLQFRDAYGTGKQGGCRSYRDDSE